MQKDIDLEEIISVLNQGINEQEHMSFRLSEDYEPNFFRYSKDDQLQEITFDIANEAERPQTNDPSDPDLQIIEEEPEQRICFILDESKEQPVKPQPIQKPSELTKNITLSRKTSIKASEHLKRKISVKKQTDEFTKKYDDLFDQIFFKEKAKGNKQDPPKKEFENKKQDSQVSTNQNLSESNVSSENNLAISRAIDEALVNGFNSLANPAKNPIPKVAITYESKIIINILPPKELLTAEKPKVETSNAKPKIKFSFGQVQSHLPSKKQLSLENVPYHIKEEARLPKFMFTFRSKTNSYPNFYSKKGFTEEKCLEINKQFSEIIHECRKSIKSLKEAHLTLHELFTNIRELYKRLSLNILNKQSEEDPTLLDFFLSKDWTHYLEVDELESIRPRDYFLSRPFNELEFITFINSFQEITNKIQTEALLDSENPQSIKSYMHCRDQIWGIEKNLRLLSEDLYLYTLSHFNLPSHFLQAHKLLKSLKNQQAVSFNSEKDQLLKQLLFLQENKDVFGSSWLGHYTIECLLTLKK